MALRYSKLKNFLMNHSSQETQEQSPKYGGIDKFDGQIFE